MTAYNSNGSKRADLARLVVTGALQKDEGRLVKVLDEDGAEHSGALRRCGTAVEGGKVRPIFYVEIRGRFAAWLASYKFWSFEE
jgi:hypothetical protein